MKLPRRRVRAKRMLITLSAAAALATAIVAPAAPALASSQTVTVNFASTTGTAHGVGSGFLYGLSQDGTGPDDGLLASLAPTSGRGGGARLSGGGWIGDGYTDGAGFTTRIDSAIDQAKRLNQLPTHAPYDLLVSDLYGADTTQPSNTVYPCANGNCSNWISFIDDVVADVQAAGVNVNYDIWNEPDNGSFWAPGYAGTQYFAMWNAAVNEIRRLVPSASIVGPSVSNFNNNYITEFLTGAKAAGTVPTYLNWHFSGTPVADAATVNGDLAADGITGVKLSTNEYLNTSGENAGFQAWYLAQLATSGISYADHAIWADCCNVGSLDQTLVQNSSGSYVPTGQWWVYKDYADVTGSLASVSDGSSTDAVAAEDGSRKVATVLLGDDAGNTGTVTLNLNGLSAIPWAFSGAGANVVVQRIPDQNPLAAPIVVGSQTLAPGTASLSLPINWVAANDAYFVTITPATTGSVTIDGAVTTPSPNYFQYGSSWGETTGVSDMYDGTANWSGTPGSTAVLHVTGNQVALHAVKDVDQGMMDVSVDGSAPVTIDDYSPTRDASGIVWTSAVLGTGPHVVTITIDSAKNPASSGNTITIDSADVISSAAGGGTEAPYGGTAAAVPGTVQAANYDTGGQGVAYNVTSVNGTGNSYRSDGVDLETCTDTGCGDDLGWTTTGQWFKYTVNVATAGTYTVSFRFASPSGVSDALHIASSSGANLSGSVNAPDTGGWQTWVTATASVTLPAGRQTLTVDQDNGGWNLHSMAFAAAGGGGSTTNLALNRPVTGSSVFQNYVPSNAVDGNASTYWESTDGAGYPQTLTVNLGSAQTIGSMTLDLPPLSNWNTRTETLSVLGSTNGTTFTQIVGSAGYTFNPATGNTVTISLPSGISAQYVELSFTANTGWDAAQLSELQIYG
jgi:Carbohydrate binding module (family 6)/F5/8 type C domain